MDAFMQVTEVWTLVNGAMVLHAGAYGPHGELGDAIRGNRFLLGEGLPGSVWSSGKPQIWDDLAESHALRPDQARRAGLDAGIGIPIAAGGHGTNAVAVLLCDSSSLTGGCIERWDVDEGLRELFHAGGYYGELEPFARLSPRLRFPLGNGLPGLTWQRGLPTIVEDTRSSASFLRAEAARECGIESGIGIPIYRGGRVAHVVVLLSAEASPLARAFEVWVPSHSDTLRLDQSFYARGLDGFAKASREKRVRSGEGLVGKTFRTELPQLFSAAHDSAPFAAHPAAVEAGLQVGIGIPVSNGHEVLAVVALLR